MGIICNLENIFNTGFTKEEIRIYKEIFLNSHLLTGCLEVIMTLGE